MGRYISLQNLSFIQVDVLVGCDDPCEILFTVATPIYETHIFHSTCIIFEKKNTFLLLTKDTLY